MDKSLKIGPREFEKFEKRDLERTESSEMGPKECRTPVTPYQSLYGLKTYNLSEATNFHIRAFYLLTSCHMMQFKYIKLQNWQ